MSVSLDSLGEAELLKRLARFAPPGQLNDDTAAIPGDSRPTLINTDVLVDGVHFSDATTSPIDVGWRAVAVNLSDLAASGAVCIEGITVALVAPGHTSWSWVNAVYQGIAEALAHYGGTLLGGDCSRGQQRLISITALGRQGELRLHRGHAQPGDVLVTSGAHGLSRLGLACLQADPAIANLQIEPSLQHQAIRQHQRPVARLGELRALISCKPDNLPWRAGGTDSSDGLLAAVEALCTSSGCGARLERTHLPRPTGWPSGTEWDQWCLCGGEDFELVLSLPQAWAERWQEAVPQSRRIGRITPDVGTIRWDDTNKKITSKGFDHFAQT